MILDGVAWASTSMLNFTSLPAGDMVSCAACGAYCCPRSGVVAYDWWDASSVRPGTCNCITGSYAVLTDSHCQSAVCGMEWVTSITILPDYQLNSTTPVQV